MSEFFFVIKTILFSALVLLVLQMRVGGATLEQHSESFIYRSHLGGELQSVARGAVKAGQEGWSWISFQVSDKVGHSEKQGHSASGRSAHEDVD